MSELTEFLRKKKKEEVRRKVSFVLMKEEWMQNLNKFLNEIKEWVSEAKKEGLLEVIEQSIEISEEGIGTYKAPSLILRTGRDSVVIKPIGTMILGARGRVDMTSPKRSFMFLLSKEKVWVLRGEKRVEKNIPLTQSLFTDLLEDMFS